jgi:hypothetical protein
MQKTSLTTLVGEEILRGCIFGITFFIILILSFGWIATAASNGWVFWDLLNKLLVKTWDDPTNDGTARNAAKLGNIDASQYAKVGVNRTCPSNQCIYALDVAGNVQCR